MGVTALALAAVCAHAATYTPAAHEIWNGSYRCGSMGEAPGYTSSIRMRIDDGAARIDKESAQIREMLSGQVAADGTLRLEGAGTRKPSGPVWRYSFEGRFEGSRFVARGAMLSSNQATRLRECSMMLARASATAEARSRAETAEPVARAEAPRPTEAPKPAAKPPPKPVEPVPSSVADALIPVQSGAKPLPPRAPGTPEPLEKAIDLVDRNDAAVMEGTVARGVPHRYLLAARKGQVLAASLKSEGARLDLYEPGSTLTQLSGGFVVQGSRLGATDEGKRLRVELTQDGRYLLIVRALEGKAFYTLDLAVDDGGSFIERWRRHRYIWIALVIGALALAAAFVIRRKRSRWLFRSG